MRALKRAMERACPDIHHSDQGVQYAATAYTEWLAGRGVSISMAAVGKPEENSFAERLMRTIKEEVVVLSEYEDLADARRHLGRFLDDVYNTKWFYRSTRTWPTPGVIWAGSSTTCTTPSGFIRRWAT